MLVNKGNAISDSLHGVEVSAPAKFWTEKKGVVYRMTTELYKHTYPELFQQYNWGNVRSEFDVFEHIPPESLISNVNIVPFIGEKCVTIQLDNGNWEIPGGTKELGEDYMTTLKRELLEEAGARLMSAYEAFGAWKFVSSAKEPYRPHLPHPIYFRLVGFGDIQLVADPMIPEDGEKVIAVEAMTVFQAKEKFIATGRRDLAELYDLASCLRSQLLGR